MSAEPAGLHKSLDDLIKERSREQPRGGSRGGRSFGRGGRGRGFGPQGGIEKRDGSVGGRGQFQGFRGGRGNFRGGFRGGRSAGRGSDHHRQPNVATLNQYQRREQDFGSRPGNARGRGPFGSTRPVPQLMQMQQMPPVFGHGSFVTHMGMQPMLGMPAGEVLVEDMVEQEAPQFEVYLSEDGHVCANMEGTDIVTISPQGSVFLDTGGYYTEEVMASMNQALAPIGLQVAAIGAVEEGNWQVQGGGMLIRFTDGMEIPPKGPQSAGRGRAVLNAFDPQAQELAQAAAAASSAAALSATGMAAPAARMAQGVFGAGAGGLNPAGALAIHQRLQQAGLSMEEVLAVAASAAGGGLAPGIAPLNAPAAGMRTAAVKPAIGHSQLMGAAPAGRGAVVSQGMGMQSDIARRLRAQGRLE